MKSSVRLKMKSYYLVLATRAESVDEIFVYSTRASLCEAVSDYENAKTKLITIEETRNDDTKDKFQDVRLVRVVDVA